eukprot:93924-Rhodomonas_salina.1
MTVGYQRGLHYCCQRWLHDARLTAWDNAQCQLACNSEGAGSLSRSLRQGLGGKPEGDEGELGGGGKGGKEGRRTRRAWSKKEGA